MIENIDQMRERHKGEIEALQLTCKHESISDWMEYHWAIGHYSHDVKVCNLCGKTVEERRLEFLNAQMMCGLDGGEPLGEDFTDGGCLAKM